jgi:hypothetical protein
LIYPCNTIFLKRNLLLEHFLTKLLILTADELLVAAVGGKKAEKQLSPICVKGACSNLSLRQAGVFQEIEPPRFPDSWHIKVVRLSNLHTSHLYLPGNVTGTHFC